MQLRVRGDEVDYVFIKETSHLTNIAEYMAYYNLKPKEYRRLLDIWIKENNIIEERYRGENKTTGDKYYYMVLDIKNAKNVFEMTKDYEYLVKRLKTLGAIQGNVFKTNMSVQQLIDKIL